MKLTKKNLKKIVPLGNMVLIKPERENDQIITKSGLKLYIDTSFEEERHAVRYGEVIAVPKTITFGTMPRRSIDWETDMELQVGDKVFFNPGAPLQADSFGDFMFVKKEKYYFLRYDEIYMAIRKKETIMLNGYILIEPIGDEKKFPTGLIIPETAKKNYSERYGIVRGVGSPIRSYYFGTKKVRGEDFEDISVGDKIIFKKFNNITLEHKTHAKLEKEYYRIQRKNIVAKVV